VLHLVFLERENLAGIHFENLAGVPIRVGIPDLTPPRLVDDLRVPDLVPAVHGHPRAERGDLLGESVAGLVPRDPAAAVALLEPVVADPARDVRAALLAPLAQAYATTRSGQQLVTLLRDSERDATRRLVMLAALLIQDGADGASRQPLAAVVDTGPPLARRAARLGLGLLDGQVDGVGFLATLVP